MTPFQEAVRERFYRHVRGVPPAVGRISEIEGPDVPGYSEAGYDLELALEPLAPARCPLRILLTDVFGQVELGAALLDYYPHGRWRKSDGSKWVDLIEQDVVAAVYGRVKDVSWLRGGRPIHVVTYACEGSEDWRGIHTWGLPFMTRILKLVPRFFAKLETRYLPYLESGPTLGTGSTADN